MKDVARHPGMLLALGPSAAVRVILPSVSRCERVSTAAFRSMHPDGVAELPGATALRMPPAHSSPMLNRIVDLGLDGPATEEQLDDAIAAMAGLRYYVSVSPSAQPAEIGDWLLARGFEPSWGWMQFERGLEPLPADTSLELSEIGPERSREFAARCRAAYGLPAGGPADLRRAARTTGWTAGWRSPTTASPRRQPPSTSTRAPATSARRNGPRVPRPRRAERAARDPHRARPRARLRRRLHRDRRAAARPPERLVPQHRPRRLRGALRPPELAEPGAVASTARMGPGPARAGPGPSCAVLFAKRASRLPTCQRVSPMCRPIASLL